MLCESTLWRIAYCSDSESPDLSTNSSPSSPKPPRPTTTLQTQPLPPLLFPSELHGPSSCFRDPRHHQERDSQSSSISPLDSRRLSPGVGIPGRTDPLGVDTFLVPSSCHSICKHYSDLHIAGGQVLTLSPGAGDQEGSYLQETQPGPFLLSGDVPPPSLLPPPPPPLPDTRTSRRWREGSGRERPSLLQGGQPLSNSQLNGYLEQKLLELYKQYLTEGPAGTRPVMASELLQCSLEQITLQLSKDQKLETAQAKDMLLSCLMRATSSQQSSEISTPLLQISTQTK